MPFDSVKYSKEYRKNYYERLEINIPKGKKELVKERAAELGKSVNEYVTDLLKKDIITW